MFLVAEGLSRVVIGEGFLPSMYCDALTRCCYNMRKMILVREEVTGERIT